MSIQSLSSLKNNLIQTFKNHASGNDDGSVENSDFCIFFLKYGTYIDQAANKLRDLVPALSYIYLENDGDYIEHIDIAITTKIDLMIEIKNSEVVPQLIHMIETCVEKSGHNVELFIEEFFNQISVCFL